MPLDRFAADLVLFTSRSPPIYAVARPCLAMYTPECIAQATSSETDELTKRLGEASCVKFSNPLHVLLLNKISGLHRLHACSTVLISPQRCCDTPPLETAIAPFQEYQWWCCQTLPCSNLYMTPIITAHFCRLSYLHGSAI